MELVNDEKALFAENVAHLAVQALIDEVTLTPKPGLVDCMDNGSHTDLNLDTMMNSAKSLYRTFFDIAYVSYGKEPSQALREHIAAIGREGEKTMFSVTGGINTHKGAIWALGLLSSAFASKKGNITIRETLTIAGNIASFEDGKLTLDILTNGQKVKKKLGINGAKEEAENGFPTIVNYGLPILEDIESQQLNKTEKWQLVLLNFMANLNDTCILHRGGIDGLEYVQEQSRSLLEKKDLQSLIYLNKQFIRRNLSPGGSADLLAALMFLTYLIEEK